MSSKAIREMLAAAGVVASLVFVGFEVRQNTIASRAAAYQAIGVATASAFDSWAHDRAYVDLVQKPASDMDAIDWEQFTAKMTVFARLGETVLLQVEQGLLPPDAIQRLGYGGWATTFDAARTDTFALKVACVWPSIRDGVSASFREYVEGSGNADAIDCDAVGIAASR